MTAASSAASSPSTSPSARAAAEVLVLGPAYCDLLFAGLEAIPELGTERFASGFLTTAGGSAITAVALRRLGRRVALVADIGDDPHGRVIQDVLHREGVDARWMRVHADAPTPVTAVLSTPADRAFVTHLPTPSEPPDLDEVLAASGARHLHVGGFPAALALPDLMTTARRNDVTVSFDPGWDERSLRDPRVLGLAASCDVLMPSRSEAARLADLDDGADAQRALSELAATRTNGTTIVKDGPRGAVASDPLGTARVTSPTVVAVDPTGAGDVFDAGFLDAWLSGAPLESCLRSGAICGARAVTAHGGASAAPYRDEIDRLLAETSDDAENAAARESG